MREKRKSVFDTSDEEDEEEEVKKSDSMVIQRVTLQFFEHKVEELEKKVESQAKELKKKNEELKKKETKILELTSLLSGIEEQRKMYKNKSEDFEERLREVNYKWSSPEPSGDEEYDEDINGEKEHLEDDEEWDEV